MPVLWIILFMLALAAGLLLWMLLSPLVILANTQSRRMEVQWPAGVSYLGPLPGSKREGQWRLAGRPIPMGWFRRKPAGGKKPRARQRRQKKPSLGNRLVRRCLRHSEIRRALARQAAGLARGLLRSAEVPRWQCQLSLPDPALTGFLAGTLGQLPWGPGGQLLCNFWGNNGVLVEVRIYPVRVAKAAVMFLIRLPYRHIFRQCLRPESGS